MSVWENVYLSAATGTSSPAIGVIGTCKPPDMCAGNKTRSSGRAVCALHSWPFPSLRLWLFHAYSGKDLLSNSCGCHQACFSCLWAEGLSSPSVTIPSNMAACLIKTGKWEGNGKSTTKTGITVFCNLAWEWHATPFVGICWLSASDRSQVVWCILHLCVCVCVMHVCICNVYLCVVCCMCVCMCVRMCPERLCMCAYVWCVPHVCRCVCMCVAFAYKYVYVLYDMCVCMFAYV